VPRWGFPARRLGDARIIFLEEPSNVDIAMASVFVRANTHFILASWESRSHLVLSCIGGGRHRAAPPIPGL
jgi:hypothetical protein